MFEMFPYESPIAVGFSWFSTPSTRIHWYSALIRKPWLKALCMPTCNELPAV
jgi:hypothetical protein